MAPRGEHTEYVYRVYLIVSRVSRVKAQTVNDLVEGLALRAYGDPHEIEILGGHAGDRRPVRLVVVRREELLRVDRRHDAPAHRALVGSPQAGRVGLVDQYRLDEHRQIVVAGRVR